MPQRVQRRRAVDVILDISVPVHLFHQMQALESSGADRFAIASLTGVPFEWVQISLGPYPDRTFKH